jgi:hypothetical protein
VTPLRKFPHPEVRVKLASKGEESQERMTPSASRRLLHQLLSMRARFKALPLRCMRALLRRLFVPLATWLRMAITIVATLFFVAVLLVAAAIAFLIDFAFSRSRCCDRSPARRAASERLP